MSGSYKHAPVHGNTTAESEKDDKRFANRRWRRRVKWAIRDGVEVMPLQREVSNVWCFDKDGKGWREGSSSDGRANWWEEMWRARLWRK